MKMLSLSFLVLGAASAVAGVCEPKLSIFASDVKRIAKQRNVSIAESARMLKAAGVSGFDCNYKEPLLPELAKSALKPVNFYGGVDFVAPDGGTAVCKAYLAAAKKYGAERVMIIPDGFREGPTAEEDYAKIRDGLRRFVAEVRAAGIVPMVEDYGGTNNICSHMSYLKRMMDDVPQLEFALDSGNFYYAGRGDDILEMMRYTKGRIGHVHLKDQTKEDNHVYATLGLGAVPNAELVRTVASWGYDGWYTFENPVDPDRYADIVRQVAVVKLWVSEGRGMPGRPSCLCSECGCGGDYVPPVCTDAETAEGFVPLFNGHDLSGWVLREGEGGYAAGRCGELVYDPMKGKGMLLTDRDYADFTLRFEFKMTSDCNNGLAVRTPFDAKTAAYDGLEIQMIDDDGYMYNKLFPQVGIHQLPCGWHGSVYGVIPAKRQPDGKTYLRPAGEWNEQAVTLAGSKIKVVLNGTVIVDDDLSRYGTDGTTMDKQKHPGLRNKTGRIGWISHGYPCRWRRIRIKESK